MLRSERLSGPWTPPTGELQRPYPARAVRAAPAEVMASLMRGEPVDPLKIYFRCNPSFETTSASLGWINERMFVGAGMRHPAQVVMRFFCLG